MGIIQNVKRLLMMGSFALSITTGSAFAEEKSLEERVQLNSSVAPTRVVAPYFLNNDVAANPLVGFESNSSQWFTFNESVGKASDVFGKDLKLDEYFPFRMGFVLLQGYLGECSNYFSHEVAHGFYSVEHSNRDLFEWMEFDLGVPDDGFIFFKNKRHMDLPFLVSRLDLDGFLVSITSGINQQEENMRLLHEECVREDRIFFDEGLLFSMNKLSPLRYLISKNKYTSNDVKAWYAGNGQIPDMVGYAEGLRLKGINVTKKDLMIQNGIAVFGSLPLYYDLYAVANYICTGERSVGQAEINTPAGGITLPLINYYLTKNGGFYNIPIFVRAKNGMLFEGEFGNDVDFIGNGKVNMFRLGSKVYDIAFFDGKYFPRISPYCYVNLKREEILYNGFVAGAEITLPVYYDKDRRRGSIVTKIEYKDNDILENEIKLEPLGWNVSVAFRFNF